MKLFLHVHVCQTYLSGIAVDILLEEGNCKLAHITGGLFWQGKLRFGNGNLEQRQSGVTHTNLFADEVVVLKVWRLKVWNIEVWAVWNGNVTYKFTLHQIPDLIKVLINNCSAL